MATCSPFAPFSEPSDKNNLACAFSINIVLTAPRADSGGVCFGVSVAVLFSYGMFCFLVITTAPQSCLPQLSCQ